MIPASAWFNITVAFCTAFAVCFVMTHACIGWLRNRNVIDIPNHRSSHTMPTPRGGGIGILAGLISVWLIFWLTGLPTPATAILIGTGIIAITGLVDDLSGGIPMWIRLCLQIVAAWIVIVENGGLIYFPFPIPFRNELGWAAFPVTLIWIVGVTNIYNFLDGIDGYAATQGLIAGIALACLNPSNSTGLTAVAVSGACLGFLPFNWHPAKIFMGDVGSLTLGFLLATLPLQESAFIKADSVLMTALALWMFLSDGTMTLVARFFRGERIWLAHQSHLYQRLASAERRHDRAVYIMAISSVAIATTGVIAMQQSQSSLKWIAIMFGVIALLIFHQITLAAEKLNAADASNSVSTQTRSSDKIQTR